MCGSCFVGASTGPGPQLCMLTGCGFFLMVSVLSKQGFLDEGKVYTLSVGIGTNIYNVVRDYTDLVK